MKRFTIVATVALLGVLSAPPPLSMAQDHKGPALSDGPYSTMEMLLERTVFRANVLKTSVQVGEPTRRKLEQIVSGNAYSTELNNQVARAVMGARNLRVRVEFVRNITFGQYLEGVRENIGCARDTQFIGQEEYESAMEVIPRELAPLKDRGIRSGDVLIYDLVGNSVETTFLAGGDDRIVNYSRSGSGPRNALIGSYFAPCSDFREKLVRSLFEDDRAGRTS